MVDVSYEFAKTAYFPVLSCKVWCLDQFAFIKLLILAFLHLGNRSGQYKRVLLIGVSHNNSQPNTLVTIQEHWYTEQVTPGTR